MNIDGTRPQYFVPENDRLNTFWSQNELSKKVINHDKYYTLPPLYKDIYADKYCTIKPSKKLSIYLISMLDNYHNLIPVSLYLKVNENGIFHAYPCKESVTVTIKMIK